MRILQVAYSCVPDEFRGGVPKAVFELARAQAALGHEVEIYATTYNSYHRTKLRDGDTVAVDGVRIRYFSASSPRWMRSPSMRSAILESAGRFDVLHGHNTFLALNRYVSRAARLVGTPAFFHSHGALDPAVVRRGVLKQLRKRFYINAFELKNFNSATGVLALTEQEREQLRYWGVTAPIHVLANGVAMPAWVRESVRERHRSTFAADELRVVFIGRLVPKKAIHILVEAFAAVRKTVPTAKLVIAGDRSQDPAYMAQVDDLIERLELTSAVEFVGFLKEEAKLRLLASASLFCHATESEGMALAVLEAMSAGLPTIVSTECYMNRAVEAGAVVEVDLSSASIAEALTGLLQDSSRAAAIGAAGVRYSDQHHSWRQLATGLVDIYRSAVQQPASSGYR